MEDVTFKPAAEPFQVPVIHKVKIITPKSKYTNIPYHYAIPWSASRRQPVTGQEKVIPWVNSRVPAGDGRTVVAMTSDKGQGKIALTPEDKVALQMGESPYIIDPNEHIIVVHGHEYDDSYISFMEKDEKGKDKEVKRVYTNQKDHAELTALLSGSEAPIARSKSLYMKNKHNFYIEDREFEAQVDINKADQVFEAESFVRNDLGSGRYSDLIILLGHEIRDYKFDKGVLSEARMKAIIFKACKEHPDIILKMKGTDSTMTIFIVKLLKYGIIAQKKDMEYFYGDIHIGGTFDAVKEWMRNKDNSQIVTKWSTMIGTQEKKAAKLEEPVEA